MGKPVLGEHSKLEVIIEESYEFKVWKRSDALINTYLFSIAGGGDVIHLHPLPSWTKNTPHTLLCCAEIARCNWVSAPPCGRSGVLFSLH